MACDTIICREGDGFFMKQDKFCVKLQYIVMLLVATVSACGGIYAGQVDNMIIKAAAIILPVFICMFLNPKDTLLLVGMLLPVNRVLTLGGCSVLILVVFATVIKEILKGSFWISKEILFASFAFLIYVCIVSQCEGFFGAAKVVLMLFYFADILRRIDIKQLFKELVSSIVFGITMSSVINILITESEGMGVARFRIGENGGNILGIECGVLAICLLVLLLQRLENTFFVYIELLLLLLIGLMTASKSFLLALAVGGLWILFFSMLKSTTTQMKVILFGTIGLVVGFIMLFMIGDTFASYCMQMLHRIVNPTRGDISNGRFDIWKQYFEVFQSNPKYLWFGNLNYMMFGIEWVAHNMIIEQIALYGIVGSIILTYLYMRVFKELNKSNKCHYKIAGTAAAPLVAFLVVSMASHTLLGFPQTLLLFICWMSGIGVSDNLVCNDWRERTEKQ